MNKYSALEVLHRQNRTIKALHSVGLCLLFLPINHLNNENLQDAEPR